MSLSEDYLQKPIDYLINSFILTSNNSEPGIFRMAEEVEIKIDNIILNNQSHNLLPNYTELLPFQLFSVHLSHLSDLTLLLQSQSSRKMTYRYFTLFKSQPDLSLQINRQMLLKDSKILTLRDEVKKILRFSTAINNTYVMVTVEKPGEEESLIHLGQEGEVLFKKTYPDIINLFAMPTERDVIVLDVPNSRVAIYDLKQQNVYHFAHQFLFDDVAQMEIETFPFSRYFCIVEHGTHNDHRLKLSYYDFTVFEKFKKEGKIVPSPINHPQINVGELPCLAEYLSSGNQWTYDCPIRRANSHSMISWFKPKHTEDISFYCFEVKEIEGSLKEVKVKNTLGMQYGINGLQVEVATLWEARPDIFYLVCNSNKIEHNARNAAGVINNIYVLDRQAQTIRESNFYFKDAQGFAWNDQLIEYFSMGPVSVFHTFRHENGKALTTPVYYVSHETETIVAEETWEASCYFNFFVPGFDTALMVEAYHENGDVKNVNVTTKKVMDPKEISLHFMLHINEDFDDDLLKDAVDLLHE